MRFRAYFCERITNNERGGNYACVTALQMRILAEEQLLHVLIRYLDIQCIAHCRRWHVPETKRRGRSLLQRPVCFLFLYEKCTLALF